MARARQKPKDARGQTQGSISWLHEGELEISHGKQPGTVKALTEAREKQRTQARKD
jgi:hypothetical protein